jgi:hypothetical protein
VPPLAIDPLATLELLGLGRGHGRDDTLGNPECLHDVLAHDPDPARRDGPHGELLVTGDAKLPHLHDIERCPEGVRHLVADGHATARQRDHQQVVTAGVPGQGGRQPATGILPVRESSRLPSADHGSCIEVQPRR